MASTYGLTVFFGEEKRLVKRGEMAWKASHLNFFEYDGVSGRCVGKVHASMKDKEYLVEVRFPGVWADLTLRFSGCEICL